MLFRGAWGTGLGGRFAAKRNESSRYHLFARAEVAAEVETDSFFVSFFLSLFALSLCRGCSRALSLSLSLIPSLPIFGSEQSLPTSMLSFRGSWTSSSVKCRSHHCR